MDTASRRQMPALFLIVFINLVGFGVVLPVFPFFGTMVEASPAQTTLAMAAYSFGQFVGAPVWGKLSDRYGRRPILIASLVGAIASYIVMAHARDIWLLGGSRLVGGLMAGNIAAAFAYVGDITTPDTRPKAMGLLGAAFGLGFIFGPAIGGLIAGNNPDVADFAIVGYTSAAISALAALGAFFFLPESLTPERRAAATQAETRLSPRDILRVKPVVGLLMAITLLAVGAGAMMETTFAFFVHDEFGWGPSDVGLAFAGIGVISAVLQAGGAAPLARRFGSGAMMVAGLAIYAAGLAGLSFAASGGVAIAAGAVMGLGLGLFSPAFQTITSDQTNDADRGLVTGMTQGASSLGRVIGPAGSGAIYQDLGHRSPFAVAAVVVLLALAAAAMAARQAREREALA